VILPIVDKAMSGGGESSYMTQTLYFIR